MKPAGSNSEPSPAPEDARPDVDAILCADDDRVDRALARAVREALLMHKRLGNPIHVWQDGRIVEVPPDEIPV